MADLVAMPMRWHQQHRHAGLAQRSQRVPARRGAGSTRIAGDDQVAVQRLQGQVGAAQVVRDDAQFGADLQRLGHGTQVLHQLRGAGGIRARLVVECGGDAGTACETVGDVGGMLGSGDRDQMGLLCLRQMGGDVENAVPGVAGVEQHSDIA